MDNVKTLLKSPLYVSLSTIAAIGLAILLRWARVTTDLYHLEWGAVIFTILVLLLFYLSALINRAYSEGRVDKALDALNDAMAQSDIAWLVNERYVSSLAKDSKESWIFAPEMTHAINRQGQIFLANQRNIKLGRKYVYFMPDRPRNRKAIADYRSLYQFAEGQVKFYLIPTNEFLFYTENAAYGVGTDDERAIEWLPRQDIRHLLEMDKTHTNRLIGIGRIFMTHYKPA